MDETVRPVRWVGSSLRDLKTFPRAVQRDIKLAIFAGQCGETYSSTKPLAGFKSASVLEIVAPFDTDTYRAVYTVRFGSAIFASRQVCERTSRWHNGRTRRS